VDELYRSHPPGGAWSGLGREFEGVLDMLSGRYPSDEFAELRPRLVWDRLRGVWREGHARCRPERRHHPRPGALGVPRRRGGGRQARGELDEEMVFESRAGEVFVLGATSWRITEITRDRVLVLPPRRAGEDAVLRADRVGVPSRWGARSAISPASSSR